MKKLDTSTFNEIRGWFYRNARPIELAQWRYRFENGSKEDVLTALAVYQNTDGGFGHALEPDNWNPASTPYTTLNAINKLIAHDCTEMNHPIWRGIFNYLKNGAGSSENGWLFSLPSNDAYPRAPWWTYDAATNEYESLGVTAGLVCFLLQYADRGSALYERAESLTIKLIETLRETDTYGDMGINGYVQLNDTLTQLGMTEQFDTPFLSATVHKLVNDSIERGPSQWAGYCKMPSQFITSPDSAFYVDNQELMEKELDYIIETRPADGVWDITWSWFDNGVKYPDAFAIARNWWKADIALGKLTLLSRFGRLG